MKFHLGQELFLASFESTESKVTCPDCAGSGRLRVLFADDTMVSIECAGCSRGYEPPTGWVRTYVRTPKVYPVTVTGITMNGDKPEWRTDRSYDTPEDRLFENEADALLAAAGLAAQHDREELEKIATKEKPTRTWAWNAHYHRKEIKEAKRRIEYNEKKLAAANLKARAEKAEGRTLESAPQEQRGAE